MNKTARNERLKHTASFLNSLGGALVGTGVLTPVAALVFGTFAGKVDWALVLTVVCVCGLTAYSLHITGHRILGDMEL